MKIFTPLLNGFLIVSFKSSVNELREQEQDKMLRIKFRLVKEIEKKRLEILKLKKKAEKLVRKKKVDAIKRENQAERELSRMRARYRLKSAISKKAMEDAQQALFELKKAKEVLKSADWIKDYKQAKRELFDAEKRLQEIVK